MPKDYAKNIFTHKHSVKRKDGRSLLFIRIILSILLLGIVFYWFHLHQKNISFKEKISAWFLKAQKTEDPKILPLQVTHDSTAKENTVRFDFYTELPKMPLAVKEPLPQYVLQLGVFKNQVSANQFRLSLLLAGVESEVVKIEAGDVSVYSVQRKGYTTERQAKLAQKRLQQKGIESVVKKQ